ncbi:hypothetical protein L0F63_004936 [Massospora cicadina]|nr:hypothetical protein L0F63_004936 [Massospora cicadina]
MLIWDIWWCNIHKAVKNLTREKREEEQQKTVAKEPVRETENQILENHYNYCCFAEKESENKSKILKTKLV